MPLGASITYGIHSSDGNGYRKPLAENLAGTKLKFIGSVRSGSMDDNYNEGHPGATIRAVANFATLSLGYRPNVILVHAGTNDFDINPPAEKIDKADERLGGLIDELVFACPDATILVAQLVHAANPLYESRIQEFNNQVPRVVAQRAKAGHRVMVADMRSITKEYLADGIHPTDVGYKKMADIWFAGIKAAYAKGWIQRPIGSDPPAFGSNSISQVAVPKKRKCRSEPIFTPVNGYRPITDRLGHNGLAKFHPKWLYQAQVSKGRGLAVDGIHFADLNGDGACLRDHIFLFSKWNANIASVSLGRADYLWVNPKTGAVIAYLNTGHGNAQRWAPVNNGKHIAAGGGSGGRVFFADINGDRRADYIYVHKDGKVVWWQNDGPSARASVGWKWHGPIVLQVGIKNANPKNVLFGDLNGDGMPLLSLNGIIVLLIGKLAGRDDFLYKDAKGGLLAWLNIRNSDTGHITWDPQNKITQGWNTNDFALADIDGDGT